MGSRMSFDTWVSSNFTSSVPVPRRGMAGAVDFEMSYFIDVVLFKEKFVSCYVTTLQRYNAISRGTPFLFLYI